MVSTWNNKLIIEQLNQDFEKNLQNKPASASINFYKVRKL